MSAGDEARDGAQPRRPDSEPDSRAGFLERLAEATPAPGGGAAAGRVGRIACSLLRMVTGITLAKIDAAAAGAADLARAAADAADLGERLARLEREDSEAFDAFIAAVRMPRSTAEEKELRREARDRAAREATRVPLETMAAAHEVLELARRLHQLAETTPLRAESDLVAAVELGRAVVRVAELNVTANLPYLEPAVAADAESERQRLSAAAESLYAELATALKQQQ